MWNKVIERPKKGGGMCRLIVIDTEGIGSTQVSTPSGNGPIQCALEREREGARFGDVLCECTYKRTQRRFAAASTVRCVLPSRGLAEFDGKQQQPCEIPLPWFEHPFGKALGRAFPKMGKLGKRLPFMANTLFGKALRRQIYVHGPRRSIHLRRAA